MATCSNARDKLELLQVKETELIRLRREADSQLLNELSLREDRLAELRSDFEHNVRVLKERDQIIANLERSMAESAEQQKRELSRATKRADERYETTQEDYNRRLLSEVDQRLAEREHSLREELAASAAAQLSEREREIKTAYDRASTDREATCKRREATADKRVQDVERSAAMDLKDADDRYKALEVELRDRPRRRLNLV